jgi:hypothetical protein
MLVSEPGLTESIAWPQSRREIRFGLDPAPDILRARFDEAYQVFIVSVAREILLSIDSRWEVEPAHHVDMLQGSLVA